MISAKERRTKNPDAKANELSWNAFMKRHVRAHLLTGEFDQDDHLVKETRQQLVLLRALAQVLCRRGNYAVTVLRQSEGADLAMVGTQCRKDADRIARAVRSRNVPRFGPWLSHRSFKIDTTTYRGVAVALARGLSLQGRGKLVAAPE